MIFFGGCGFEAVMVMAYWLFFTLFFPVVLSLKREIK